MRRRSALLFTVLLVSGCSDDGEQPPPAATVPSEATTSSTAPAAPDPAVIPDDLAEIDEEYVQAVVDELFAVDAKATEIFVTTKTLDDRAISYLEAIYTEEEVERELNSWFHALASSSENLVPGVLKNDVKQILTVTEDCVYLEALRDYSNTTTRDVAERTVFLGLTPKLPGDDPEGLNPTPWMLFMDGFNPDGSRPENPCDES